MFNIILLILLLFGCSSNPKPSYEYLITIEEKSIIKIFDIGEEIPFNYQIIDDFYIGPYHLNINTVDCGYESVIKMAKEKTSELGGDAFKITELKRPDVHNTCYRINALVLKSND